MLSIFFAAVAALLVLLGLYEDRLQRGEANQRNRRTHRARRGSV
jgi:hypothetical protein